MTPQELLDAVRIVEARVGPDCEVSRNPIGNLALISVADEVVGFIDLNAKTPEDSISLH